MTKKEIQAEADRLASQVGEKVDFKFIHPIDGYDRKWKAKHGGGRSYPPRVTNDELYELRHMQQLPKVEIRAGTTVYHIIADKRALDRFQKRLRRVPADAFKS